MKVKLEIFLDLKTQNSDTLPLKDGLKDAILEMLCVHDNFKDMDLMAKGPLTNEIYNNLGIHIGSMEVLRDEYMVSAYTEYTNPVKKKGVTLFVKAIDEDHAKRLAEADLESKEALEGKEVVKMEIKRIRDAGR